MDVAHKSIKKIRNINVQLGAFQKQYKGDDNVKDLLDKVLTCASQLDAKGRSSIKSKSAGA